MEENLKIIKDVIENYQKIPFGYTDSMSYNMYYNRFLFDSSNECFNLCVRNFATSNLTKDENNCIINCTDKYYDSYFLMGERISVNLRNNPQ